MTKHLAVCGVYRIQSSKSNSFYVGSSKNIKKRWYQHVFSLKRGTHHARLLQGAWNTDGEPAFSIEVLEVVNVARLRLREDYWAIKLKAFGGSGGCNGMLVALSRKACKPLAQPKPASASKARSKATRKADIDFRVEPHWHFKVGREATGQYEFGGKFYLTKQDMLRALGTSYVASLSAASRICIPEIWRIQNSAMLAKQCFESWRLNQRIYPFPGAIAHCYANHYDVWDLEAVFSNLRYEASVEAMEAGFQPQTDFPTAPNPWEC